MRNLWTMGFLASLFIFACAKDDKENVNVRNSVSLLIGTSYQANPNYNFEYNEDNQLIKCITNGGVEVKEYYYDANGVFTGFKETTQSNAIYPIRRFSVDINTANEISGDFNLYDPNDVLDPTHTSQIKYELEDGLLKRYTEIHQSGNWEKSFEHNATGDLTAIQMFENPASGHLYRLEFSEWDDMEQTNIFASLLQTYPAMDIIPGIKLSNHNMMDKKSLYKDVSCCDPGSFFHEYNDFDQITRIFVLTADVINEEGEIETMGGEELTIATFEYMVVE